MEEKNNYIVGAGLNGLIAAYYLSNYKIIDKKENVGGQFNSKFLLGPRFVHYNKHFEKLLNELNINYSIKTAKVAYYYKDRIYKKLTNKMKEEYALKTRNSKDDKSFLNAKNNSFKYLDFNYKEFINKIFNKVKNRFIDNKVINVYLKTNNLLLENFEVYEYDKLISTIHYNAFCKIADIKYKSKNKNIYLYYCKKEKEDFSNFDFIYYIDKNNPINRITYKENTVIIESIKDIILKDRKIINKSTLIDYKLSNKNRVKKFKNVTFIGRYANLDNSKKIDSVIQDIKNVT